MTRSHARLFGLVSAAAVATLALTTMTVPAFAAEGSALGSVQRAEHSLGLNDDTIGDSVAVLHDGQPTTLATKGEPLRITVGDDIKGSSAVVYTADKLDESSVRLASVFASPAVSSASWDLGSGKEIYLLPDGRVSVGDTDGNFIAGIQAPWAVDANGKKLSTYYTVDGTSLTQHVDYTTETAFPVVADPTIHTYIGYYTVKLNHSESVVAVSTTAACAALFSKSPFPAMKALTIGCTVFAAYGTPQLAGGHCLTIHVAGFPPAIGTWWPTFPKC